jgi:hypothetical protein
MNKLLLSLLLLIPLSISAQNNIYTSGGISQTVGPPTYTPGRLGNVVAIDTATGYWYVTPNRLSGSAWLGFGFPLANISGSVPPAFTPTKFQPRFVINAVDSMYYYNGTAWKHVNKGGSSGITSLNGLTAGAQTFATGTTGSDFNISSATSTHTFNLPIAATGTTGKLSSTDWNTFNNKVGGSGTSGQVAYWSGASTQTGSSNFTWDNLAKQLSINSAVSIGNPSTFGDSYILANGLSSGNLSQIRIAPASANSNLSLAMYNSTTNTEMPGLLLYGSSVSGSATANLLFFGRGGVSGLSSGVVYFGAMVGGNPNANSYHIGFNVSSTSLGRFQAMQLFSSGNIIMQNGGTYTDNGYKLRISSTNSSQGVFSSGPGASSSTYSLICTDSGASTSTAALAVRDDSRVGIRTNSIDAGAALEIDGTTGGVLFPRLTTTQRDNLTLVNGLVIYNSTTDKLQVYAGGAWVDLH